MSTDAISERVLSERFEILIRNESSQLGFPKFNSIHKEVVCLQGVADFVATLGPKLRSFASEKVLGAVDSGLDSSARILSLLKHSSPRSEDFITKKTGFSQKTVRALIGKMLDKNVIRKTAKGNFLLTSEWNPPPIEMWAFELKISNWKRAIYQAMQYKAFASRVYTVFPKEKEKLLISKLELFRNMKIGVIVFDLQNGNVSKILLKATKEAPSSHLHYLYTVLQMASLEVH